MFPPSLFSFPLREGDCTLVTSRGDVGTYVPAGSVLGIQSTCGTFQLYFHRVSLLEKRRKRKKMKGGKGEGGREGGEAGLPLLSLGLACRTNSVHKQTLDQAVVMGPGNRFTGKQRHFVPEPRSCFKAGCHTQAPSGERPQLQWM